MTMLLLFIFCIDVLCAEDDEVRWNASSALRCRELWCISDDIASDRDVLKD